MSLGLDCVAIARTWLGTPFQAHASVKGVGADCAGLIEGVARELGIAYPARNAVEGDFVRAALECLVAVASPQAGNIILLSAQPAGPPVHAAIITQTNTIIHAHWRAGIIENRFGNWFAARVSHIFAWPELEVKSHEGTFLWHP
jgi:NlpC/P60 family putative phage cell wall peptidase